MLTKPNCKTNKLHTAWIIVLSIIFTAYTCSRSIIKYLMGNTNRAWVDEMIQAWANRILKLVKVNYIVINPSGSEPKQNKPTVIMCNHSSVYDIPLSFKAFPKHSIRMLAKKEFSRVPIMAGGMKAAEFLFIDRKNRQQAMRDLIAVKKLMESGIVIWIAPEGTRSKDGKLAPFKKGCFITAIEAKATIIPIGIRGAYNILPARTTAFNLNQHAEIHIGEAIDAAQYTKDDLVKVVYKSIANLLAVPIN